MSHFDVEVPVELRERNQPSQSLPGLAKSLACKVNLIGNKLVACPFFLARSTL